MPAAAAQLSQASAALVEAGSPTTPWVVVGDVKKDERVLLVCRCPNGHTRKFRPSQLEVGAATACRLCRTRGPRKQERHPEYRSWIHIRQRCLNPKCSSYQYYGGRGIRVCERWSSFEVFLADVGPRPSPGHSIDRIDNEGHYEPGNVRWATIEEQANNRRNNHVVSLNGEQITVAELVRRSGLPYMTVLSRLWAGRTPEQATEGARGAPAKPCGGALTFGELARLRRELEPLVLADCEACGGCGQVVWSNAAEAYVPAPHVHVGGGDTERRGEKCPACIERAVLAWIDGQAESEAAS